MIFSGRFKQQEVTASAMAIFFLPADMLLKYLK